MKITQQKAWRRQRLGELFDELGQTELASRTKIAASYLWQMAYGEGKKKRGISDATVEKIETGLHRKGFFDPPKPAEAPPKKFGKDSPGWTDNLSSHQLLASALVMDHLHELNEKQTSALIGLIESFLPAEPARKNKARPSKAGKGHREKGAT